MLSEDDATNRAVLQWSHFTGSFPNHPMKETGYRGE